MAFQVSHHNFWDPQLFVMEGTWTTEGEIRGGQINIIRTLEAGHYDRVIGLGSTQSLGSRQSRQATKDFAIDPVFPY
jgi:hypothetical protein